MQFVCWLLIVLAVADGTWAENGDVLAISSGTSFGRCVGYCRQSINVMSAPLQVIVSREANFNQASYPPVHLKLSLTLDEWANLVSLVNIAIFQGLDDRIGCPDCADGGPE